MACQYLENEAIFCPNRIERDPRLSATAQPSREVAQRSKGGVGIHDIQMAYSRHKHIAPCGVQWG